MRAHMPVAHTCLLAYCAGGQVWHGPSSSRGADPLSQLAFHLDAARSASQLPDTLGAFVGTKQQVVTEKALCLRWYQAAIALTWTMWTGPSTDDAVTPFKGGSAHLFGSAGIGKTVLRTFMAASILQRRCKAQEPRQRACLIVFDRASDTPVPTVMVRQRALGDGSVRVEAAVASDSKAVEATVSTATAERHRVYHLLRSSNGTSYGRGLGWGDPYERFTLLTALPTRLLLKEYYEEVKARPIDMMYAPCSTRDEMHALNARRPKPRRLSTARVDYIVAKFGPMPRRLSDCTTDSDEAAFCGHVQSAVDEWARHRKNQQYVPSPYDLEDVHEGLIVRETRFDDEHEDQDRRFDLQHIHDFRWTSRYVWHCVTKGLLLASPSDCWQACETWVGPHDDVRARLVEDLLLTCLEVGAGGGATAALDARAGSSCEVLAFSGRVVTRCVRAPGGRGGNSAFIRRIQKALERLPACNVTWMAPDGEVTALHTALDLVATAPSRPVLIRPLTEAYPGIDGVLLLHFESAVRVLFLKAATACRLSLPMSDDGVLMVEKWMGIVTEASSTHRPVTATALMYMLPREDQMEGWGHQATTHSNQRNTIELVQLAYSIRRPRDASGR